MANLITIARLPLLYLYIYFLYSENPKLLLFNIPFIIFIIAMDSLDGYVARKYNETSLLGSVLDIAIDRVVEIILWIVFAHLGLISIVVPIIVVNRGVVVDALRGIGMKDGIAPFDQIKNPINQFLVKSRFMRALYGIFKTISFVILSVAQYLIVSGHGSADVVLSVSQYIVYFTIFLTILRGLPVIIESIQYKNE